MVIDKKEVTAKTVDWITSQTFNNVLLLLILGAIMWGASYTITTAIPRHLEQISKGYQSIENIHREERTRTLEIYDKWMSELAARNNRSTPTAAPTLSRTP